MTFSATAVSKLYKGKQQMPTSNRVVGLTTTIGLFLTGLLLIALRPGEVSSEDMIAARQAQFDENAELVYARSLAPYRLRYPQALPPGAELEHVAASDTRAGLDELSPEEKAETDLGRYTDPASKIVAVDMYWILPNGGRLHMWQSNDPSASAHALLETADPAPLQGLPDIPLGNGNWRRIDFYAGSELRTSLNHLFEDGVFVSVTGEVDVAMLSLMAGSVHSGI
jgi:hypothetical protein